MAPIILLVHNCMRLDDHPALVTAAEADRPVIPLYIYDTDGPGDWAPGAARRWWLMGALEALGQALKGLGSDLVLRKGAMLSEVKALVEETGAEAVYFTRGYEPHERTFEDALKNYCDDARLECRRFAGNLLIEPEQIYTGSGKQYEVFTPFWKRLQELYEGATPLDTPEALKSPESWPSSLSIDDMGLEPKPASWAVSLDHTWDRGCEAALARLEAFFDVAGNYASDRDIPAVDGTSKLSPYLAAGEISPRRIWHETSQRITENGKDNKGLMSFLREVGWREFSRHLLFHFPEMPSKPLKSRFENFAWETTCEPVLDIWQVGKPEHIAAWQMGKTGFPIIDAGLRQLWQTGWMHNRVRMIVSSFLVKDLLWHWHVGEAWFWDTLVDADLANNSASWQWVAGCGADAAPYFRIFNPILQGEKFDKKGAYVREFVPELADLPDKYIHKPFEAPEKVLKEAGITLGLDYPHPIIDRKKGRERALAAFEASGEN